MLPAFKELGCLSQEHLTLFKEDVPAGGGRGEPKVYGLGGEKKISAILGDL